MANQPKIQVGYGLTAALPNIFPAPVVAKRAPTTADTGYQLGQLWIYPANNASYILTSVVNNSATWQDTSGGAGVFSSLTVNPGPTNLSTVGNGAVTIGNATNTGLISISTGTGNTQILGNGNSIFIGTDAHANNVQVGVNTNGALTTITGGNGTGVGTAALLLQTAVAGDIQIGIPNHTGAIYLGTSTAGDTINIASGVNTGAETVNILNSATGANATVSILSGVGTAGAGTLSLGNNTRVTTIDLGNIAPAAARTTTIAGGNSAQNDTVSILNGNPSANTQTVNILSGTPTGGTQVLNLGAQSTHAIAVNIGSGTGLATVQIANGAAANVVTMGSTTANATTTIQAGGSATGAITLNGAGMVSVTPATGNSATTTVVINAQVGVATYTGQTTAAGATITLTLTNSVVAATSAILATVANVGSNDAELTVQQVKPGAGSFIVICKNNGAAALNGNITLTFWVIAP